VGHAMAISLRPGSPHFIFKFLIILVVGKNAFAGYNIGHNANKQAVAVDIGLYAYGIKFNKYLIASLLLHIIALRLKSNNKNSIFCSYLKVL